MKAIIAISASLIFFTLSALASAEDFLSAPDTLRPDPLFGDDLVYYPDDVLSRLPKYNSVMVDEPIIFLAEDSDYKGFKASDLAAVADMFRQGFMEGLSKQPVSFGNFKVVDEPGPSVLYLRLALKDVYISKHKRGLLAYTPVGAVVKGVHDIASDAIDKTTLVELKIEAEMQDTESGDVLFAAILDRGHRKAHHQKEDAAGWEVPGNVANKLGRRLACRLDNARLAADKQQDCVKMIPIVDSDG